jgi:hypothetical protein
MAVDNPHHIIADPDTGKSEPRQLVTEKDLHFSVLMAIRDCPAFSGTPKLGRGSAKNMLADSVVKHFRQSGYRVFGIVPHNGPVGNGKHMWKKDGED